MSLEGQIQTTLETVMTTATLNKLTASDTNRKVRVCELAAAKVESKLGDVADTDDEAINLGAQIAAYYLASTWPLVATDKSQAQLDRLENQLDMLAEGRRNSYDPESATPDFANLDNIYPTIPDFDDPDSHD